MPLDNEKRQALKGGGAGRYFGPTIGPTLPPAGAPIEEQLQQPLDLSLGAIGSRLGEALVAPAQEWLEYTPRQEKFMDVLYGLTDVAQPGRGAGMAAVFGSPQVSEALRKGAGAWLGKAKGTLYKKGTRLGDLFRKIGYAPGKEASTVLREVPELELIESVAAGGAISIGGKNIGQQDLAAIMNILGHEKGHIFYRRLQALGKHVPEAKQVASILEDAAMASTGFRRPGSVMQTSVGSAKYGVPFREAEKMAPTSPAILSQVDAPHPQGRMLEEALEADFMGEKRLGERVADLLSELTTFKGQQGLNPKQREFLSAIMDLY